MIVEREIIENTYNGNIFETAVELRESVQTIMASLKKHKIKFEKPKHIYGDLKRTDFSEFQKSLLIGSVLGDGHIEKRSHLRNALFREEHSMDQVNWLKWKHRNLKPFTTTKMWGKNRGEKALMPDGKGGKRYYNIQNVCSVSTGVHPYITKLHNLFYKNRVKILPMEYIEKKFNMLVLAVLIGDDGNFCENSIRICTDNFTKKEVYFLANLCSNFYKSRITVREEKKDKFRIVFTEIVKDLNFFRDIKKVLPICMHHKITPVLNEHQVAAHYE